jgi:hypothetical protein
MRRFNDNRPILFILQPPVLGVACDQHVLPGMRRHWGELMACATHPPDKVPFTVCKGSRVHQQVQPITLHDRQNVANRGARHKQYGCTALVIEAAFATANGLAIVVERLS